MDYCIIQKNLKLFWCIGLLHFFLGGVSQTDSIQTIIPNNGKGSFSDTQPDFSLETSDDKVAKHSDWYKTLLNLRTVIRKVYFLPPSVIPEKPHQYTREYKQLNRVLIIQDMAKLQYYATNRSLLQLRQSIVQDTAAYGYPIVREYLLGNFEKINNPRYVPLKTAPLLTPDNPALDSLYKYQQIFDLYNLVYENWEKEEYCDLPLFLRHGEKLNVVSEGIITDNAFLIDHLKLQSYNILGFDTQSQIQELKQIIREFRDMMILEDTSKLASWGNQVVDLAERFYDPKVVRDSIDKIWPQEIGWQKIRALDIEKSYYHLRRRLVKIPQKAPLSSITVDSIIAPNLQNKVLPDSIQIYCQELLQKWDLNIEESVDYLNQLETIYNNISSKLLREEVLVFEYYFADIRDTQEQWRRVSTQLHLHIDAKDDPMLYQDIIHISHVLESAHNYLRVIGHELRYRFPRGSWKIKPHYLKQIEALQESLYN